MPSDQTPAPVSTDYSISVKEALELYTDDHLNGIATGAERLTQLQRVLESNSSSLMNTISIADLTRALTPWKGGTRNRYRAALTHFWKWARSMGYCDLVPTLMPGKEAPRDVYFSLFQLRRMYFVAGRMGDWCNYPNSIGTPRGARATAMATRSAVWL